MSESEVEKFKFKMSLINEYIKKDFVLGEKDRGFAVYVLTDFLEWAEKNNYNFVDGN